MENRDPEGDARQVSIEEALLDTAAMQLAQNVIEDTYSPGGRQVLKKGLQENEHIVLFLSH